MQYEGLIDTVSDIVKIYGVSILNDSKFWNILTDSYSFASDYSLRDTFKRCIAEGYVSEIVSLKGKSQKTIDKIKDIGAKGRKVSHTKDSEITVILFSVAIAIGSCSKKEYLKYNQGSSYTPQKPSSNPNSKNSSSFGKYNFGLISSYLVGLIIALGCSLLYWTYLEHPHWWISCIALLYAVVQLGFCSYILKRIDILNKSWSNKVKGTGVSCYLPILGAFILNDLFSFLFCSNGIRESLKKYFLNDFIPHKQQEAEAYSSMYYHYIDLPVESPGWFGLLLMLVLSFAVFSCGFALYSSQFRFNKPRFPFYKRPFYISILLIVLGYGVFFYHPFRVRNNQEQAYITNQNQLKADRDSLLIRNEQLREQRKDIQQNLSFKGIRLGISFDTAIGYAISIDSDSKELKTELDSLRNLTYNKHKNTITIYNPIRIWASFPNHSTYYYSLSSEKDIEISYQVETYSGDTNIDNIEVDFTIIALNDKVIAIHVVNDSWSHSIAKKDFVPTMLKLYTSKYGEPEIEKEFPKEGSYYIPSENVISYQWTFKDGYINLSEDGLAYVDYSFSEEVNKEYAQKVRRIRAAEKARQDSIRAEQERQAAIQRRQEIQDSIRRVQNHKNAINEI